MSGRFAGVLAAALAAALGVGCGRESDSAFAADPAGAGSAKSRLDAGGHPLSLPTDDPGTLAFEGELTHLVNQHRASIGLAPLADAPELRGAARAHSSHMITHRFFAHASPEGLSPGDRLTLNGIEWSGVGENIAAGYATPQAVFDAWMASPAHRENIESDRWTRTGAGYALDRAPSDEFPHAHLWTQTFTGGAE